jgi:hypothetical protein
MNASSNNNTGTGNPFAKNIPGYELMMIWRQLPADILTILVHTLISVLTLWPSAMNGSFRWFILNQSVPSLLCSLFNVVTDLAEILSYSGYVSFTASKGFLSYVWSELDVEEGFVFGYMQPTTVCLTSLTRYWAVVKPLHYQNLTTPRRIIAYCLCCYLLMIPNQARVWKLFFGENVGENTASGYTIITMSLPMLVSFVLNIITLRALNVHLNGISGSTSINEARDSRTIVIANLIETIVPMLTLFPYYLWVSIVAFLIATSNGATLLYIIHNFPTLIVVLQYFTYYKPYSPVVQGLTTLFVMAPYRRLLLRPFRKNVVTPAPILIGRAPD